MRWERERRAALALLAATFWPIAASLAQSPAAERIVVTGTSIPRIAGESGLPVQTIDREQIEHAGIQTTQDLLERVSANMSWGGWNEARGVGNIQGFTAASMRGLGSQRTLVLLNGRRLAPYALSTGTGVDLSGIPVGAIERVEVLKDGASAVYGTDAIGGVINFILRRDFRGGEAMANYQWTEQGGADSGRASAALGMGALDVDGYNAFLSVDHWAQKALLARDREFSRTGYLPAYGMDSTSASSWPANISQPRIVNPDTGQVIRPGGFSGLRNPTIAPGGATAASCLPPLSLPTFALPTACKFDFASVINSIPESDKTSVIGRLAWKVGAEEAFAEASYYRGRFESRIAPSPLVGVSELRPDAPTYPTAFVASLPGGRTDLPVRLFYRLVEFGPRVNETTSEQWRGVAGLKGSRWDWDYEATLGYNANRQVEAVPAGWFSASRLLPLIRSGVVNPFAPNTPQVVEQVLATQITGDISQSRASHLEAELRATSTPWSLSSGSVAVALGVGARRERLELANSQVLYDGDLLSAGDPRPSLTESERKVAVLFAEANVPLAPSLELNLAVRTDHYSDFGTTTNPKVTLRWQPSQHVLLRGAVGTGFRAPTLADLFIPLATTFIGPFDDPLRCAQTGFETDCAADFEGRFGGNPSLQPEKSKQLNAGLVVEPVRGLSISLDYYHVRVKDLIAVVPPEAIFANYPAWGPSLVVRAPPNAATPGLPGRIDYVLLWSSNAGDLDTSGVDLDARYRFALPWGTVNIGITGTYVDKYKVEEASGTASGPGNGAAGAIPRWRHFASIDWTSGAWGATLGQTYQSGYDEIDLLTCPSPFPGPECTGRRRVGALELYDLQARYTGWRGLALSAGIRNVFNRDPPRVVVPVSTQIGYDPSYADARGRAFYLTARYSFR